MSHIYIYYEREVIAVVKVDPAVKAGGRRE